MQIKKTTVEGLKCLMVDGTAVITADGCIRCDSEESYYKFEKYIMISKLFHEIYDNIKEIA